MARLLLAKKARSPQKVGSKLITTTNKLKDKKQTPTKKKATRSSTDMNQLVLAAVVTLSRDNPNQRGAHLLGLYPHLVKRAEKKGRSTPNREQIKTARNNLVSLKLVSADGSHIKLPGKIKKRIEDLKVGSDDDESDDEQAVAAFLDGNLTTRSDSDTEAAESTTPHPPSPVNNIRKRLRNPRTQQDSSAEDDEYIPPSPSRRSSNKKPKPSVSKQCSGKEVQQSQEEGAVDPQTPARERSVELRGPTAEVEERVEQSSTEEEEAFFAFHDKSRGNSALPEVGSIASHPALPNQQSHVGKSSGGDDGGVVPVAGQQEEEEQEEDSFDFDAYVQFDIHDKDHPSKNSSRASQSGARAMPEKEMEVRSSSSPKNSARVVEGPFSFGMRKNLDSTRTAIAGGGGGQVEPASEARRNNVALDGTPASGSGLGTNGNGFQVTPSLVKSILNSNSQAPKAPFQTPQAPESLPQGQQRHSLEVDTTNPNALEMEKEKSKKLEDELAKANLMIEIYQNQVKTLSVELDAATQAQKEMRNSCESKDRELEELRERLKEMEEREGAMRKWQMEGNQFWGQGQKE